MLRNLSDGPLTTNHNVPPRSARVPLARDCGARVGQPRSASSEAIPSPNELGSHTAQEPVDGDEWPAALRVHTTEETGTMSNPRLPLGLTPAIACILFTAACSGSDRLSAPPAIAVSDARTIVRSGVEGLRQDIAWMRSLPSDTRFGTSAGPVSRDGAVSELQRQLETLTHPTSLSARSVSPSPDKPRFDYISYGDVGGQTYVSPAGTDAQGYKYETTYTFTSCSQSSITVAEVEPQGTLRDFVTGTYIGPLFFYPKTGVQYVSELSTQGILTTRLVYVEVETKHTCQLGGMGDWPYKLTRGYAVI